MPEPKQPHLNGAYYGPSIPPASETYHSHGRRGRSCNPFSCCCGCIFRSICGCIFSIIFTIIIVLAIVGFVIWLIFRPNEIKFYANDASLTQFEFSPTNNTLFYNLSLNMTIRNPNRRIGVYYDSIEARAFYEGQRFSSTQLQRFYQGRKNTSELQPSFRGSNLVVLGSNQISNYNQDRDSGSYDIEVRLYLRVRFRFGVVKSWRFRPTIECSNLKIPLNSNGASSGTFEPKRCGLDW